MDGGRKESESPLNDKSSVTPIKIDKQVTKKIYDDQSPTRAPAATPLHHENKEDLDNLDFVRDDSKTQEIPQAGTA